jgi:hypothetical protein
MNAAQKLEHLAPAKAEHQRRQLEIHNLNVAEGESWLYVQGVLPNTEVVIDFTTTIIKTKMGIYQAEKRYLSLNATFHLSTSWANTSFAHGVSSNRKL